VSTELTTPAELFSLPDLPAAKDSATDAVAAAQALIAVNLALSWFVLLALYAERYATRYYREAGGLRLAGTDTPDDRDFATARLAFVVNVLS
jgi:uncharacterized membrane protein